MIGPIDYIKLTYTPIQDSIKIYIDRFETQQWEYEEDTNTVHLLQTPSEGALIEAVYVKAPEEEWAEKINIGLSDVDEKSALRREEIAV